MKIKLMLVFCIVLIAHSLNAQESDLVTIEQGTLKGQISDGITSFLGIPYAKPPIGNLRWRPPQPPESWTGTREADEFGLACPQILYPDVASMDNSVGPQSEDCLYLNIWKPEDATNKQLPVMVWIHGGGFAIGGTKIANYSGEKFAQKGVVLVSIAYRIGVLGFMAHPELTEESGRSSGNYGLMDQIAALKWVQDNIAAFGGDPKNVTIFGESAGGISVSLLCGSPLTKGLFQRAISQSGGAFGPVGGQGNDGVATLEGAENKGLDFAQRMGANSLTELRALPVEKLLQDPSANMGGFWPICDRYVILDDQYKLYSAGGYNDVDVLLGSNSNEGALFVNSMETGILKGILADSFGPLADRAQDVYPATNDSVALQSARNIFRDQMFAWPTWTWARLQAQTGKSTVFVYYFDQQQPPMNTGNPIAGASHSDEINYVFGHVDQNYNYQYTEQDKALSSIIMDYWVNFASTGNPNGKGLPDWPQFNDNSNNAILYLKSPVPFAGPVPNRPQLEFLEEHYKRLRNAD